MTSQAARRWQGLVVFLCVAVLMLWGATAFVRYIVVCLLAGSLLIALSLGAQSLWRALFKTQPPFGLFSLSALVASLLLAAFGILEAPKYAVLLAAFGENVPAPTMLLMQYGFLFPVPFFLLLVALFVLRKYARRERYFAGILAVELALMVLAVLTFPIVYVETVT